MVSALLIVGNLATDTVDPNAEATKVRVPGAAMGCDTHGLRLPFAPYAQHLNHPAALPPSRRRSANPSVGSPSCCPISIPPTRSQSLMR